MIYRYHLCDKPDRIPSCDNDHYKLALEALLFRIPEQIERVLEAETTAYNEIMMKDNQEAYLVVSTELDEGTVDSAIDNLARTSGLAGTRLN